jgi:hypothetical protein
MSVPAYDVSKLATLSRDAVILDLVGNHGLTLNAATKAYVELRKAAGLHTGVVSRKEEAFELLSEETGRELDPRFWLPRLQTELEVSEGAARDYLKAYADEHGLTVKSGRQSDVVLDWIAAHAPSLDATDEAWEAFDAKLVAWGKAEGRSSSNVNEFRKGVRLHRMLISR